MVVDESADETSVESSLAPVSYIIGARVCKGAGHFFCASVEKWRLMHGA